MTSTPRLDSLTADGTGFVFDRLRLADGHVLALKARPGAGLVDEVALLAGLTPPDTEDWEDEGRLEGWLKGVDLGEDGGLFLSVPVRAVRDLCSPAGAAPEPGRLPTRRSTRCSDTSRATRCRTSSGPAGAWWIGNPAGPCGPATEGPQQTYNRTRHHRIQDRDHQEHP